MALDLLSSMALPPSSILSSGSSPSDLSTYPHAVTALDLPLSSPQTAMSPFAPSLASIFPTFSYPDINFLIWLFGFRYRRLARATVGRVPKAPGREGGMGVELDPRVDWMGARVLGSYYSAVRRALVVAVVVRAMAALGGVWAIVWWGIRRARERRGRLLVAI